MFIEIFLAIVQAATEFFPISSSGHLALFSNLIGQPNLFFFTALHLASLVAVLIFTRKEIKNLITFNEKYRKLWVYLIIGTIPAAIFGYFFKDLIEKSLNSYLFLGIAFIFTGIILFFTKFCRVKNNLNWKSSFIVGLFQVLALFPGVSRSGMTISSAMLFGIKREEAIKFSFLLFIPLALGAGILEIGEAYISWSLLIAFFVCLVFSLFFLKLLSKVIKQGYFWIFSIYCFFIGIVSLALWFFI